MLLDRFLVTHLDVKDGYGYVRHVWSKDDKLLLQPIRFEIGHISEVNYSREMGGIGYTVPSPAVAARVPEIGATLVGSIAYDRVPFRMAIGANGLPFLRNAGYIEDYDKAREAADADDGDDDFGDDAFSEEADEDEIDDESLAEILHGRRHEMYNS